MLIYVEIKWFRTKPVCIVGVFLFGVSSMMRFFHCCLELLWNRNSGKLSTTLVMFELINEGSVMLQAIAGTVQYM
jgi:hypothetical protein